MLAICDDRLIALADLPAGEGQGQIRTTKLLEHCAQPARDCSRRGVVEKVCIEASG